jgi:4-amino-4-deoxy-L-arabinose transferase-like glycosyltransferase
LPAMRWERQNLRRVVVVFLVALAARLLPALLTIDLGIALDDMFQYDALAESIRLGQGFTWYGGIPTAARAPLYPLFLAGIYTLLGHSFAAARIVQAFAGSLLPLVIYDVGRRLVNDRVGLTAAWAVALYPMFLLYPLGLATENLFFVFVSLAVLLLIKAAETSSRWCYVLSGVVLGLTILTRSVISGFLVLLLPWLWYYADRKREAMRNWILVLLPVIALTIPWSVRNSLLYGELVFVESSMGFNLYLGYHPEGSGTFDSDIAVDFLERLGAFDAPDLGTEKATNEEGMREGLRFIREDPGRALWLLLSKLSHFLRLDKRVLLYFYSNNFMGELPPLILALVFLVICLPWVVLLLLSVPGMVLGELTRDKALVYLLFAYLTGVHVLIMAEPRFHLVMVPLLAVFAAQGAISLSQVSSDFNSADRRLRRETRWRMALSLLIVALLLMNWAHELGTDADKLRLLFAPGGNLARFTY